MSYRCDVCDELFTNRPSLEEHKKNCKKDEEDSFSFGPLLGALAVGVLAGGAIYAGVKAAQAIEEWNTDRDSTSTSGIESYRGIELDCEGPYNYPRLGRIGTDRDSASNSGIASYRGLEFLCEREYSPPRLGGIGTDRESTSNSGIESYRGLEFECDGAWDSPLRLDRIGTDRDSASNSGIASYRGLEFLCEREYSPPRLGGIGTDRDSTSNSGIESYRGIEFECEGAWDSPLRLDRIGTDAVDFRSRVTATDLNSFIADKLQPTEEFKQEMGAIIHNICEFLRTRMKPNLIRKGGSLGKGTSVRGWCDLDLVMVVNGVDDAADLERQLPEIKNQIKDTLRQYSGNITILQDSLTDNVFQVKFSVKGTNGQIDVDLLPTFKFEDLQSHYRRMRTDEDHIPFYSVSLVERRVNFVKQYRTNVKSLIRLVKYWKKKMVPSGRGIPNSYFIELITIHLWEENGRYPVFNMLKAFHSVMEALEDYESLYAIWTTNYFACDIPDNVLYQRPLVLDPSNPTNNVCWGFKWEEIQSEAIKVLQSQMLKDVSSTSWK